MALNGLCTDDVYYERKPEKPDRDSKTVPSNIEQHLFRDTSAQRPVLSYSVLRLRSQPTRLAPMVPSRMAPGAGMG
jgi:hypothetical protein